MLDFDVRGFKIVLDRLDAAVGEIDDLEDFFGDPAVKVMQRVFSLIFRGQGATRYTRQWAPLARSTIAQRSRRGRRVRILWDTGRLRASYVRTPSIEVTKRYLKIWSDVPYARFHETGTSRMPARPVIGYAHVVAPRRLQTALNKYLRKKLNADN